MVKGVGVSSMSKNLKQYYIVGRRLPSEKVPEPTLYRLRIFAPTEVLARSKYWYHMKRQHKVRRIQGEIVSTSEVYEKKATSLKNFGIFLRYDTRTHTVNMYKEYRDTSLCGAVAQMYIEMSGRHSARSETIQIIRTSRLEDSELKRSANIQMVDPNAKFPKIRTVKSPPTKNLQTLTKAERPTLF